MRVCQVLEMLLSLHVDSTLTTLDPLSNILLNLVSMQYRMLLETIFHFPPTATVEACIAIMHSLLQSSVLSFEKTHEAAIHEFCRVDSIPTTNYHHSTNLSSSRSGFSMDNPHRMIKQYYSFLMANQRTVHVFREMTRCTISTSSSCHEHHHHCSIMIRLL